jgi:hypothetical protein
MKYRQYAAFVEIVEGPFCLFPPLLSSEEPPQENGVIQTTQDQHSSISPPSSTVSGAPDDEPFSTYFEEKVPIPEDVTQVLRPLHGL